MSDKTDSIAHLTHEIREFARERDWEQFHDPKSLVLALVGEVGELAELFQWVPAADAVAEFQDPARKQRAGEEIADVLTYLLRLADVLEIDIAEDACRKLDGSRERFVATTVRGQAPLKN
ncbi:nucleotide pyrophosphohydrolase [Demequina flava]|uniref:nucleotide pyrophosphohydrolase n=1 Tax=Demequina flava TaxID=1095025 RepID=UPI0007838976|nr:nucleotide pyrophosphohydrolase [Demequina flava]